MSDTAETGQAPIFLRGGVNPQIARGLVQGDDFFRQLVDALPAAIYTTDAAGQITYYNLAAAELWGHRPDLGESRWCGSWKLYWPDGRVLPHDQCPMALAIKEKRSVFGMEAVAERPDGIRVPFIPFPTPIFDASGTLMGAVNMLVDITDLKHTEEAAQHLAAIVESSDDAIVSKDLNGVIKSWNVGAERLFGYSADEIIGRSVLVLFPPDRHDEEPLILSRIQRGERVDHFETVRRRKDGSLVDISLTVSPVKNASGVIIGASKIARDITDRKRRDDQIALLAREAEHRARNILAAVQATVHLTQADTPEGIKEAILGRIRALANAQSLFVESNWKGAEVRRLLAQELAPFRRHDGGRILMEGPELVLTPDAAQTIAVTLHELATNAAKYGALSTTDGRIHVKWTRDENKLLLRWAETGGPPVTPPTRQGFGTRVMSRMVQQSRGEMRFDWRPEGCVCDIVMPIVEPNDTEP